MVVRSPPSGDPNVGFTSRDGLIETACGEPAAALMPAVAAPLPAVTQRRMSENIWRVFMTPDTEADTVPLVAEQRFASLEVTAFTPRNVEVVPKPNAALLIH